MYGRPRVRSVDDRAGHHIEIVAPFSAPSRLGAAHRPRCDRTRLAALTAPPGGALCEPLRMADGTVRFWTGDDSHDVTDACRCWEVTTTCLTALSPSTRGAPLSALRRHQLGRVNAAKRRGTRAALTRAGRCRTIYEMRSAGDDGPAFAIARRADACTGCR